MRRTCIRAIAAVALSFTSAFPAAAADFKVFMPDAEPGEVAIESVGALAHDPLADHNGALNAVQEFEIGVNRFWRTEIELEQERQSGPGQSVRFSEVASENVLQFTERGQYWLDAGFFFEFAKSTLGGEPDDVTFGPIFRKQLWHTINTINLFLEKDVGTNASSRPNFRFAWETRIALGTPVEPGFQAYGRPSDFPEFNSGWPQDNRIGPQLFGRIGGLGAGTLRWNGGVLFGIGPWAPRQTWRWQAEYEIHF